MTEPASTGRTEDFPPLRPDPDRDSELSLLEDVATILLANGQTSEATNTALARLGHSFGYGVRISVAWGASVIRREVDRSVHIVVTEPLGVDISRVIAVENVVDAVCTGRLVVRDAVRALRTIETQPPVSLTRFTLMAAAGASALGMVFGAQDGATIGVVAVIAGAGACVRRALSRISGNPFLQPLAAAFLAGSAGGVVAMLGLDVAQRLVVACPCMVLVPGPHFLNGAIDLQRGRIPIGLSRLAFASLVVMAISGGLLIGLAATGKSFPGSGSANPVPLLLDVAAAGIAVAAYGSFFNMPWRTLPGLVGIGIMAHALRWALLSAGASIPLGDFAACALAGGLIAPLSDRFRLPFGACAFACVVSLIPGIIMFQAASEALALATLGTKAPASMLVGLLDDVTTVGLVLVAMGTGLVAPKVILHAWFPPMYRGAGRDRRRE